MQFKSDLKIFSVASFFAFILFATSAAATDSGNISAVMQKGKSCKSMGDSLYNCTPFECESAMSEAPHKKIYNKIKGLDANGSCISEQSNETGEKVVCKYSDESRKFLSLRMKKFHTDLANIPESTDMEEDIMADIFHNECEVVSKDADDKPVVNEDEQAVMEDDDDENDTAAPDTPVELDPKKVKDNGDLLDSNE